jgi:hypothetical protein
MWRDGIQSKPTDPMSPFASNPFCDCIFVGEAIVRIGGSGGGFPPDAINVIDPTSPFHYVGTIPNCNNPTGPVCPGWEFYPCCGAGGGAADLNCRAEVTITITE